jgi:hypothetical protein
LLLPDGPLTELIVAERCELVLRGPADPDDDPLGFLLGVAQLVRMGERAAPWVPDVARAVAAAAGATPHDWRLPAALDGALDVLTRAGERRAAKDVVVLRTRVSFDAALPSDPPDHGAAVPAWAERWIAMPGASGAELFAGGMPGAWVGTTFEVYGVPTGPHSALSFAVRWHGPRPAVLWEQSGAPVALTAPTLAPGWRCADAQGEMLWLPLDGLEKVPPAPLTTRVAFGRKPAPGDAGH